MRVIMSLCTVVMAFACRGPEPVDPPAPEVSPPVASAKGLGAPAVPEKRKAAQQAKLEAFRAMSRARAYEREGQCRVPPVVAAALGTLRPVGIPYKTVRAEAFRAMKLLRHSPGYAQFKMRLVTTIRGGDLRTALEGPLRAAGWLGADATLRTPLKNADGATLEVNLTEPEEMPSIIDFVLTTKDQDQPLETPSLLLSTPPLWPALLKNADLIGYEYGHFHATRPGGAYSDIERSAVLYAVKGAPARAKSLARALVKRGFTPDDDGTILRGAEGESMVIKSPGNGDRLLVHFQRRWTTPGLQKQKGKAKPAGKAKAR